MINPFITNPALRSLIKKLKIDPERKSALLERVTQLDKEERLKLFETLKKIFLLDLEEKRAIERIKKYWKK